jgi:2-haloacid dehalogenase
MSKKVTTIIFDLGNVLIDWNPRYVYKTIFDDDTKIDWFFENVTTPDWNENQDAGRLITEANKELVAKFPEYEKEILAYYGRWTEMLGGAIKDTVEIFRELKEQNSLRFLALTNWSAELFPIALERYEFLQWFEGIVMSGEERTRKPFPEIYQILLSRYSVDPAEALFIDDSLRNIQGAAAVGIEGIHFISPAQLRSELITRGILHA